MVYVDEDSEAVDIVAELNAEILKLGLEFELSGAEQIHGVDLFGVVDERQVRIEIRGLENSPRHSKTVTVFDAVTNEVLGGGNPEGDLSAALSLYRWKALRLVR